MKNYRSLLAIALTLLMVVSIFSLVSNSISKTGELENLLADAQALKAEGLFGRAAEKYNEAIAMDPEVSLYYAVADMYYENDEMENSIAYRST